jgi:DNA polymerase-4
VGRSSDLAAGGPGGHSLDLAALATADDTGATVLHVDMDAFYASVEVRQAPHLRGLPVVVGGAGGRGVVLSATYEARAFGIRSAMSGARARRLCPQAVFVPPQPALYAEASRAVMAVFRDVTPLVEPLSLDEAFLDVAGALRRLGATPLQVAHRIRADVVAAQGITCSVGLARTKSMAKIASGMAKPDGVAVVPLAREAEIRRALPVSAIWGVGARTGEKLAEKGLRTVADLADTDLAVLQSWVGRAGGAHLHALARGHDPRPVVAGVGEKSVGAEETFATDLWDQVALRRELLRLAERTTAGLRRKGLLARTVSLKVRWADFTTITRSRTLPEPTDVAQLVYATAGELLAALAPFPQPVRLVGVRAEQLVVAAEVPTQLRLDEPEHGWRDAERAADALRSRFGSAAVRPAVLVPPPGSAPGREPGARPPGPTPPPPPR